MSEDQYSKFSAAENPEMILRDFLAVDRTVMANEVSFLSYIRTALTMLVAAITFLKFFDSTVLHLIGWALICLAGLLILHGATRYDAMERILHRISGEMKNSPDRRHAGFAQRFLIASQSLLRMFR